MANDGISAGITSLVRSRKQLEAAAPKSETRQIPLDLVDASPFQPPGRWSSTSDPDLEGLAGSLAKDGQIDAILVRPRGERWELIAGHGRHLAFRLNRDRAAPDQRPLWETIKAEVRDVGDADAAVLVAVENLQRKQLTVLEEASTYANLMRVLGFTTARELADRLNKPLRLVQRVLQINAAPEVVKSAVTRGVLVASPDGDKEHRTLGREAAIELMRLYEQWRDEGEPRHHEELKEAEMELAEASVALSAVVGDAGRVEAQTQVDKRLATRNRVKTRIEKEAVRRAESRLSTLVEKVLAEDWSFKQIERYRKSQSADPMASGSTAPSTESAPMPQPLFEHRSNGTLLVFQSQVETAASSHLEALLEQLRKLTTQIEARLRGTEKPATTLS